MPAQLVALTEGPNILLDKPILLIGRHPEADIQIGSRKISRLHCCIAQVSNYLVVRDLGSTNGIRINGERKSEGRLDPGDELTIGNYQYVVQWDGAVVLAKARPQARRAQPALGKPAFSPGAEDEMLESCDEPVALGGIAGARNGDQPLHGLPEKGAAKGPVSPTPPQHVVPESLHVAPPSDEASRT
jgi:predicted component of type VI protein secretion system